MYNSENTLELLKKLAELRSDSYEINWEEWQNFESEIKDIEKYIDSGIEEYENLFLEYSEMVKDDVYDEEIDAEQFTRFEEIIDELIKGYIYKSLYNKKKAIEEFISSIQQVKSTPSEFIFINILEGVDASK